MDDFKFSGVGILSLWITGCQRTIFNTLGRERKNRWYVAVAAYRDSAGAVMIYGTKYTRINIDGTVLLT